MTFQMSRQASRLSLDGSPQVNQSMDSQGQPKVLKKKQSAFAKLQSRMTGVSKDKEQTTFQFSDAKTKEATMETILHFLINLDAFEKYQPNTQFNPIDIYNTLYTPEKYLTLKYIRPELIYYFSIVSPHELHEFYVLFYGAFDSNKRDFILDAAEFAKLIKFALSDRCLGQKKFDYFIKQLPNISMGEVLDSKLLQDLFDLYKDNNHQGPNGVIDYLVLYPYIFIFFIEYTYLEIKHMQGRLDLMRGTEFVEQSPKEYRLFQSPIKRQQTIKQAEIKEVAIKNIHSLCSVLKEMDIDYIAQQNKKILNFRGIENLLLKFKNLQQWITFDIVKQILEQLSKKMNVDQRTRIEKKPMKLRKIINFLALKLCIHRDCLQIQQRNQLRSQKTNGRFKENKIVYLQVIMHWNTAMYGQNLQFSEVKKGDVVTKVERMKDNFAKFVNKHYQDEVMVTRSQAVKIAEEYFQKSFNLMAKIQVDKIIRRHPTFQDKKLLGKNTPISITSLIDNIFDMLCLQAYDNLNEYVTTTIQGIAIKDRKQREEQIKDYKYGDDQVLFSDDRTPKADMSKSPSFNQVQFDEDEFKEGSFREESQQINDDEEDSGSDNANKPLTKLKRVVNVIAGQKAFQQKNPKEKDVLKACLIMDSFLQRQTTYYSALEQKQQLKQSQIQSQYVQNMNESQIIKHGLSKLETKDLGIVVNVVNADGTKAILEVKSNNTNIKDNDKDKDKEIDIDKDVQSNKDKDKDKEKEKLKINPTQLVLGKDEKQYGPSNRLNATVHFMNLGLHKGHYSESTKKGTALTLKLFGNKNDEVAIDEDKILELIARSEEINPKKRDTCQCMIM